MKKRICLICIAIYATIYGVIVSCFLFDKGASVTLVLGIWCCIPLLPCAVFTLQWFEKFKDYQRLHGPGEYTRSSRYDWPLGIKEIDDLHEISQIWLKTFGIFFVITVVIIFLSTSPGLHTHN